MRADFEGEAEKRWKVCRLRYWDGLEGDWSHEWIGIEGVALECNEEIAELLFAQRPDNIFGKMDDRLDAW